MPGTAGEPGLLAAGVGAYRRGAAVASHLPLRGDDVNPANALGLVAACPAKIIVESIDKAYAAGVSIQAYTNGDTAWLDVEVEVLASKDLTKEAVLEAFWRCPLMRILRPLIDRVSITVRVA